MQWRIVGSVIAAGLVAAPGAAAQTDGDTGVGGVVGPNYYELILSQPKAAFSTFSSAKTYSTSFDVLATTTENRALLSVVDGDVASGAKVGRLASGSKLLPEPLEARVGSASFTPLDTTVGEPLARWTGPLAREAATVKLRQKVERKASGSYRKVLLVTLSTDVP
ncbi:hypothetical protein OJ997_10740 [Solirubrobacter phytolaccae]|uniref:Uncharacterized protein n=1 Tax=Solirubrobacter phytolaccae TaxID=1404360 RepID=A0A9X3SAY1_9ACTN|nr:hypothetical protein [Solirubrobacter phytolaccae]MDA0180770.1 hypothetical protein [Solirubrobacter phytolaccae]